MKTMLSFLSTYKLLIIALFLLFFTSVYIQVNFNKNNMKSHNVDEYYTITAIHPKLDPTTTVHRALNGPRVFTYAFYPGAMIGMISHMGGNIYAEGWDYPGHNYFVRNYSVYTSKAAENMEDPNLRYFHYYLKLQAIFLVFLSLIPLAVYLWKKKLFISLFMISTLVGINLLALEERSLYYIEPFLMAMLNILAWVYLYLFDKQKVGWFWLILCSILFAITFSLKFSCFFFLALITILIVSKSKGLEKRIMAFGTLLVLSLLFFTFVNWNVFHSKEVFNSIVHDYFSNFWQYSTGNKKVVIDNYQLYNFKEIIKELFSSFGGLIFLLPVIFFYGLYWSKKKSRIKWGGLMFVVLLSVAFIIKQRVYIDRNVLPFLALLILVSGVMLDKIFDHLSKKDLFKNDRVRYGAYALLFAIVFLPIIVGFKGYFSRVYPSAKNNIEQVLSNLSSDSRSRRLVTIDYPIDAEEYSFASVEKLEGFPEVIARDLEEEISNSVGEIQTDDVVLVSEIGNNKQLTNYVLPNMFNSNEQFAEYFVFYNDPRKNKQFKGFLEEYEAKSTQTLFEGSNPIRNDLVLREVKVAQLEGKYKLYLKFEYEDVKIDQLKGCRFYLHTRPHEEDISKLPEDRIEHGFEGWGFNVSEKNTVKYGREIYVFHEFTPALESYKSLSFGIFKGCAESEDVVLEDVKL